MAGVNAQQVLSAITTISFVGVSLLIVAQFARRRTLQRGYLALAVGALGLTAVVGAVTARLAEPWVRIGSDISVVLFLLSGFGLLLFRHTFIPLSRRALRTSIGIFVVTCVVALVAQLPTGQNPTYTGPQFVVIVAFIAVWSGFVMEPMIRLWLASRGRPGVQKRRLQSLSSAYLLLVAVLAVAVGAGGVAKIPVVALLLQLCVVLIPPLLYVAVFPPRFLRRMWRQPEERQLQAALHELITFAPSRAEIAHRGLVRLALLVGAPGGVVTDHDGNLLASEGTSEATSDRLVEFARRGQEGVFEAGGGTYAVVVKLSAEHGGGHVVVTSGAFTPFFGNDEVETLNRYAVALSAGLERTRLTEEVRRASQLKSEFLSNMSHELRTPLSAILGFSDVLLDGMDGPLNDAQRADVREINQSGRGLLRLINDVLDISKIEAGRMMLDLTDFDISAVAVGVISSLSPLAAEKSLALNYEAGPEPVTVRGDEARIRQVLTNLVSNAIKFTSEGSVTVTCVIEAGRALLTVIDTGIGITPDALGYVFDEFRQADNSITRNFGGTGLGLSISRRLVEMHGSSLEVESTPGTGSRFWFSVPLAQASAVSAPPEPEDAEPGGWAGLTNDVVMVIEDDDASAGLIIRRLEEGGFRCVRADTRRELVTQVRDAAPAAVTLDIMIGDQSGWDVLQQVKTDRRTRDIPVVVVTVLDQRARAIQLGADAFVGKPFRAEELLHAVQEVVPRLDGARVLLVDDEANGRQLVGAALDRCGAELVSVASGAEALSSLDQRIPEVILVDLLMPDMSGFELVLRLRSRSETAKVPIIVVSAKDLTPTDMAALNGRIQRFVSKADVDANDLCRTVGQAIQASRRPSLNR
ncbi:MAG: ATP-binding response regulator [Candidatus Dormibacteria bacterium]